MSAMPESVRPLLPEGIGLWSRWPRIRAANLADYPSVSHLYVEVVRQAEQPQARRVEPIRPDLVEAMRARGGRVLPWAFVRPYGGSVWVDELLRELPPAAAACGERAVVLDVEDAVWADGRHAAGLTRVFDCLRVIGLSVIVTSWGTPWTMDGWQPCLEADAVLVQLARIGTAAQSALSEWRRHFPRQPIGIVAEPVIQSGLAHAALLRGLVDVLRVPSLRCDGSLSTWSWDHYHRRPVWRRELGELEFRGLS